MSGHLRGLASYSWSNPAEVGAGGAGVPPASPVSVLSGMVWFCNKNADISYSRCGKSVLSATAIDDIRRLCRVSNDHALAYFYSTFSDPENQDLVNMLLSIIGDLMEGLSGRGFPNEVMNLYCKFKEKPPNIKAVQAGLSPIIKLSQKMLIISDALDEFPMSIRGSLLSWVEQFTVDHDGQSLSILVTSRCETDIGNPQEPLTTSSISSQSKTVDPDIRSYIQNLLDCEYGFQTFTLPKKLSVGYVKVPIGGLSFANTRGMCNAKSCESSLEGNAERFRFRLLEDPGQHTRGAEGICPASDELARIFGKPSTLGQLAEAAVIESDINKYGEEPETFFDMRSLMSICPSFIIER
ncbi:hypothetical protein C7212DRAFT_347244 [Tuber magnatum]|uniref:Nephrocystin 3-like N-terminal domain-containing protein n=1 Tax=Tuber magnatum TaxID=42249 RepID=A0A317SFW3_9PEZI|nr:hypothetical protein C7212DRAFT_347244 [Tuber magnatum]